MSRGNGEAKRRQMDSTRGCRYSARYHYNRNQEETKYHYNPAIDFGHELKNILIQNCFNKLPCKAIRANDENMMQKINNVRSTHFKVTKLTIQTTIYVLNIFAIILYSLLHLFDRYVD